MSNWWAEELADRVMAGEDFWSDPTLGGVTHCTCRSVMNELAARARSTGQGALTGEGAALAPGGDLRDGKADKGSSPLGRGGLHMLALAAEAIDARIGDRSRRPPRSGDEHGET